MVEKRTLAFLTLTLVVWATIATGFAGYYFLQQTRTREQLDAKQGLMGQLSSDYERLTAKSNLVTGDYGALFGEYELLEGDDYSSLMHEYEGLMASLKGNYTLALSDYPELSETYSNLWNRTQKLIGRGLVTGEEFASLLGEFYNVFTVLSKRELEELLGKVSMIHVDLLVDYGNETKTWYNETSISSDATLFDLTRQVVNVTYSYWASMEPGHIFLDYINSHKGFWGWYYWDDVGGQWIFGPVGCDAWILKDAGVYKWVSF